MKSPIADLRSKGIVVLPYPAYLRVAVEQTVELWKQFCALPTESKQSLPYSNNADGVGYELKDGVGEKADRKENFDVTTAGAGWLRENIEAIGNPVALEFVENATSLVSIMKPMVVQFAHQCEKAYGLEGFTREVEESEPGFFIRFIHYFGDREVGQETASAHVDQSGFTLHLYESDLGLQCLPYGDATGKPGQWTDMPVSAGETVIIPAMQMQLRSKGDLRALCHRVVATDHTAQHGRYSAVCFVQLKHTSKYDKDRSGRLQEKAHGFNYGMVHSDFEKLFKK